MNLKYFTWVWGQTPSTTSTRIIAPSHILRAVDTSEKKSMCPGQSITLIRYSNSSKKHIHEINILD